MIKNVYTVKHFFAILIASSITFLAFSFFGFGASDVRGLNLKGLIFAPARWIEQSLEAGVLKFTHSKIENLTRYISVSYAISAEAQSLREDKDRFVLIDKITKFRYNFELALTYEEKIKEDRSEVLALMIRAVAGNLFLWSPLYYYLHPDSKTALRPVIKMLEEKRKEMFDELVKIDAELAGTLAAEDMDAYIKDVAKSARRRNSDFISFSLEDYAGYRGFFDALWKTYPQFAFGFAEKGFMLFDDFYAMHREVDPEFSEKTLRAVNDFRLDIRTLHARAIGELKKTDNVRAYKSLGETISAIEKNARTLENTDPRMQEIINDDRAFYGKIKDEWNS